MPEGARRRLSLWREPADVYRWLAADQDFAVWKDAGVRDPGGTSFIGLSGQSDAMAAHSADGLTDIAEKLRNRLLVSAGPSDKLGWWGWFGYEAGSEQLGVPSAPAMTPDATFFFVDRGIEFDHAAKTLTLIARDDSPETTAWLADVERRLRAEPERRESATTVLASSWAWRHNKDEYLSLIESCQRAIERGDAYQICLTNTIDVELKERCDPLDVYLRMRAISPTSHGGLLRMGAWSLLSGSPEQFLTVSADGRAITRPIKGTRRRGDTVAEDAVLVAELLASDKEQAENLMIVDLMRNDLSRVSQVGSVEVTALFSVESYPNVHQLVSTVESNLAVDGIAAAVALFPPGSMTGAPKISAITILQGLEHGPRGIYSGVWGCFAIDGSVDLAVVIRSITMGDGTATIGAGGGITALSNPGEEWDEIVLKADPMLAALGLTRSEAPTAVR